MLTSPAAPVILCSDFLFVSWTIKSVPRALTVFHLKPLWLIFFSDSSHQKKNHSAGFQTDVWDFSPEISAIQQPRKVEWEKGSISKIWDVHGQTTGNIYKPLLESLAEPPFSPAPLFLPLRFATLSVTEKRCNCELREREAKWRKCATESESSLRLIKLLGARTATLGWISCWITVLGRFLTFTFEKSTSA